MEVPISRVISDPEKQAVFRYTRGFPMDGTIKGIFAFTFYYRGALAGLQTSIYLKGISMYEQAIRRAESVFAGWRIVIYMDKATYELLKQQEYANSLLISNPLIECVIVEWPYYETTPGMVNGDILRCMRLRAFFDFNTIPVFIRDADTLFVIGVQNIKGRPTGERLFTHEPESIYAWEAAYYKGALNHPDTLIFGTSLGYHRNWHENELLDRKAPLGAFAGLQSAMPTIPCFTQESLWDEAIEYIVKHSIRSEEVAKQNRENRIKTGNGATSTRRVKKGEMVISFSNEHSLTRVGKDEQILLFVFLPKCFKHIFFFELDMMGVRKTLHHFLNKVYPTKMFQRGSNTNIEKLFQNALETKMNEETVQNRKQTIHDKNKAELDKRIQAFQRYIQRNESTNLDWKLKTLPKSGKVKYGTLMFDFGESVSSDIDLPKALQTIDRALDDPSLHTLFAAIEEKGTKKRFFHKQLQRLFELNEGESERESLLLQYREAIQAYNGAVHTFLSKVQEIDDYEKKILSKGSSYDIEGLLAWMKGGVKKGGRTRRHTKKKRSTRKRV